MDALIKILNELLKIQAQIDSIIEFKIKANETVSSFFKQGNNLTNLLKVQQNLSRAVAQLRIDFNNLEDAKETTTPEPNNGKDNNKTNSK